ncbi:MAG TPA: TonB-dependent receptor [Terriglobales bacterium]|nr:TonB-dependent receptor [Terriglobales bacterium]
MSALVVIALASLSPLVWAQVSISLAQLNGTVRDPRGDSVPKASITLRDVDTNRTYTTSTNSTGFYVAPNLPPGRYDLTIDAPGFAKHTQAGITLTVGQTATVNVDLKVAPVGSVVNVTTEVPPIEPSRSEVSQVIGTEQIKSLPISGRLFTDFALLTPGVATGRTSLQSTFTEFEVTKISFGGMRDFSNLVTVDGADTINTATGSQRATPSQEAVSEFRVVNSSFGAEYGRALGGIVNIVTKSGSNDLHGSIYDYFQNDALNARSLLQREPQPQTLRQNQFGGTLGGPLRKDKTFFFLNYEGQRRGESPTYPSTLTGTVDLITGTQTTSLALINAAKELLGLPPEDLSVLKTRDTDNGFVRLDHQFNTNNRLSLRYSIFDARELNLLVGDTLDGGGIGAPSSGRDAFIRDQSLVATLSSSLRSNLVNTALLQYARRHYTFLGVTGEPNLDIPNSLLFGHNFGTFDAVNESRFQASDSVAWVKGSHLVKFGGDFNYIDNFVISPGFTPMRIIVPGVNCLVDFANFVNQQNGTPLPFVPSSLSDGPCPLALGPQNALFPPFPAVPGPNPADFLNGVPIVFWGAPLGPGPITTGSFPPAIPTTWENAYLPDQTQNFVAAFNHSYLGFFVQDQWRVTPKLTLNFGLRYDLEKGLGRQINTDYRGFQPRIGLAYSPDSKTVIRAGFGIFDDRYNLTFFFVTFPQRPANFPGVPGVRKEADQAPWSLNQFPAGFPLPQAFFPPGTPFPGGFPVFPPGFPLPADAASALIRTGQVPANNLDPLTTVGIDGVDPNSGIPYSEQASLQVDREIGKGLVLSAGYLFVSAHKLVRARNLNVCPPDGLNNEPPPQGIATAPATCPAAGAPLPGFAAGKDNFSGPMYPIGLIYFTDNSGNSVYHGATVSVTERAGKYFRLNANYTFSKTLDDGTFTTFVSTPENLYRRSLERANSNQDIRHRLVANFAAYAPESTFLRHFEFSSIVNAQSSRPFTMFVGFDANGDTNPVTDRVGQERRNSYWGDKFFAWDIRVSRYFQFKERQRLVLSMDIFNIFNRPNVNEVVSVYGTYNFCDGRIPNQYKDATSIAIQNVQVGNCPLAGPPVPNPLFGTPRTMFNPRQFQLAAKFTF